MSGSVRPTRDDPVVRALSEAVGGPAGSRVRGSGSWWTPLRVLLVLTALTFSLGLLSRTACVAADWSGDTQLSHVCSSEIADAYSTTSLVEGAWPWSPAAAERRPVLEEPALVGLWSYAAARLTQVLTGADDVGARADAQPDLLALTPDVRRERTVFVALNAVGLAALALLTTAALARAAGRRPWDAAGFAVAPVLALSAITAWDLVAVGASALALLAWSRRRPVLAGVLVGAGTAAGVWPVLLLLAFALGRGAWRTVPPGRLGTQALRAALVPLVPVGIAAVGAWGVLNAPALLSGPGAWQRFWAVAADRGPESGTVWTVLDTLVGVGDDTVTVLSWVLVALWCCAVVALCALAPRPARTSQVAFLLLAGMVLLRPAFEPHQALWLVPFAALARPRWRDLLVWQGSVVVFTALHSWWRGGLLSPGGDGPAGAYLIGIVVLVVATLWLVVQVALDVWHPERDPVEREDESGQLTSTRSNDVVV